jgi:hypothetical protein
MRQLFFLCFLCSMTFVASNAQRHEIGVLLGGVNYIGEIGSTQYIAPKEIGYGLIYKRNLSQRIGLRAQFLKGTFSANDLDAASQERMARGLSFNNSFSSWGIGLEVNYVSLPIGDFGTSWTPYLHLGFQRIVTEDLYFLSSAQTAVAQGKRLTMGVPFGAGVKFNLGRFWVIAAEIQPQFSFTDNLDGSNPNREKQPGAQRFSTSLSSDWLVFTGISITYAFGRLPCCRD